MAWDEEMVCVCLGGGGERAKEREVLTIRVST